MRLPGHCILRFYIIFYLLQFLFLGFIRSLLAGIINLWFFPDHPLLSSYCFGFVFWLAGLTVAYYVNKLPEYRPTYQLLLATLLLFISFRGFDAPETLLLKVVKSIVGLRLFYDPANHTFDTIISFNDFAWLPYAVVGVVLFSHRSFRYHKQMLFALFLLPGITWAHIYSTRAAFSLATYGMSSLFYTLSLVLLFITSARIEQFAKQFMHVSIRVGSISYGLYIVHFPILMLMSRLHFFSGSALTFWVRFFVLLFLAFIAAFWLEKRFQPWVKQYLMYSGVNSKS
jgi:hypothetical protein